MWIISYKIFDTAKKAVKVSFTLYFKVFCYSPITQINGCLGSIRLKIYVYILKGLVHPK